MQAQRKTFRLGRRPAKQGPRPLSNNQGRVEKSVTGPTVMKKTTILSQGDKQLQLCNKLRLGTWNILSMLQLGTTVLGEEIMRLGVHVCGLSEVRCHVQGHSTTLDGHTIVYPGRPTHGMSGAAV